MSYNNNVIYNATNVGSSTWEDYANSAADAIVPYLGGSRERFTSSNFYNKDGLTNAPFGSVFSIGPGPAFGDGGNTRLADSNSWVNEGTFQWLEGANGWGFYQQ